MSKRRVRARRCAATHLEGDFGGERVAMVDERLVVGAIPAVQLHTAAPQKQRPRVRLGRRPAAQLITLQVRVVRRVDVVVRQRMFHVLGGPRGEGRGGGAAARRASDVRRLGSTWLVISAAG